MFNVSNKTFNFFYYKIVQGDVLILRYNKIKPVFKPFIIIIFLFTLSWQNKFDLIGRELRFVRTMRLTKNKRHKKLKDKFKMLMLVIKFHTPLKI